MVDCVIILVARLSNKIAHIKLKDCFSCKFWVVVFLCSCKMLLVRLQGASTCLARPTWGVTMLGKGWGTITNKYERCDGKQQR